MAYRVLVVDPTRLFRELLCEVLALEPGLRVVGAERSLFQAEKAVLTLAPDVITLSEDMLDERGAAFVRRRRVERQIAVVLVGDDRGPHSLSRVLGLEAGATAWVQRPLLDFRTGSNDLAARFNATVLEAVASGRVASQAIARAPSAQELGRKASAAGTSKTVMRAVRPKPVTPRTRRPSGTHIAESTVVTPAPTPARSSLVVEELLRNRTPITWPPAVPTDSAGATRKYAPQNFRRIVAIGASTGGSEALLETLRGLPPDACPALVVQHMPAQFTGALAQRLNRLCRVRVREAVDQEVIEAGTVLVAPGDRQMRLAREGGMFIVRVTDEPPVASHRPSVDVMFESCAHAAGDCVIGVLLTGMGTDGAYGLGALRRAGAMTIAQDEASCVAFGMPKEAIQQGAALKVLPLGEIAAAIAGAVLLA